jgi:hypothetical protein
MTKVNKIEVYAELGTDDHSLIPTNVIERWLKPLDVVIDPQIRLNNSKRKKI